MRTAPFVGREDELQYAILIEGGVNYAKNSSYNWCKSRDWQINCNLLGQSSILLHYC